MKYPSRKEIRSLISKRRVMTGGAVLRRMGKLDCSLVSFVSVLVSWFGADGCSNSELCGGSAIKLMLEVDTRTMDYLEEL